MKSLLKTTQNTRDLGGYRTMTGTLTKAESILRSDVQNYPCDEDFAYYNFQIDEGSGVPETVEAVPHSYMNIAKAKAMPEVFKCIAHATSGVMFNCTAGKDRTGVVSAILLLHAGVSDKDIIENYVLTKEYGKERLELVHKNFPEIDMNIVTPCEWFMEEFLRLFREEYGDTTQYFKELGLDAEETQLVREKLCCKWKQEYLKSRGV